MKVTAVLPLILAFVTLAGIPVILGATVLALSVQTVRPYYNINDDISIYGSVLNGGVPLSGATVTLQVYDPASTLVVFKTVQTNSSGVYTLTFRLLSEASTGTYNVGASCTYNGATAYDNIFFHVSALAVTISTDKQSYNIGDSVTIGGNATLSNTKLSGALIAIVVQNPNATIIVSRVLETDNQGSYNLTFLASAGSPLGTYTAYASTGQEGAKATAQTSFALKSKTVSADINGDGKVNILDLTLVALAFGSHPGEPRWDPRCDLDGNNAINILDITLVARAWTLS